jgi:hypothetical protein
MIEARLAVCAESVVRDAETNAVSVFNIFEEIGAPAFPVIVPKLSVLFLFERAEGGPERVDSHLVFSLNETELARFPFDVDFQGKPRTRLIVTVGGAQIPEPGMFMVSVFWRDMQMGSWRMPVHQVEEIGSA